MLNIILQAWIILTSVISILLVTDHNIRFVRIGCVIGLLGQPAWIYSTWITGQYGMLLVSFAFTFAYLRDLFPALPGILLKVVRK